MAVQTFEVQGSRPKPYAIQLREDGRLSCDCPAWLNKRMGMQRGCKHCAKVAADNGLRIDQREDGQYAMGAITVSRADATHAAHVKGGKVHGKVAPEWQAKYGKPPVGDPMLAPKYRPLMLADKAEPFRWSDYTPDLWAMEQKFDGERCLVAVRSGKVTAWSRAGGGRDVGLPRDLAPQIVAALAAMPDGDYDGEVIVKGVGLMSSDVRALVNRAANVLVLFDVLMVEGLDLTGHSYDQRRTALAAAMGRLASPAVIRSSSAAPDQAMYDAILAAGGEGVILKRRDSKYVGRRDGAAWVKVKAQGEAVVTIIGFEDSKVNASKNAVICFRMESGIESKCKVLNNDWSRRIAAGEIKVGTKIEVTYQVLLASGKARHAMAKRVVGDA
jgi:hypothetical protein